jgi:outer membrane protein assembly factor BamB
VIGVPTLCLLLAGFAAAAPAKGPGGKAPAPGSGTAGAPRAISGWLSWRGPEQTGVSREKDLPSTWAPGGANDLWHVDIASGGTPVIANGRLFFIGYGGSGPDLQERVVCLDAVTGKKLWERRYNDFLSDITYDRYAIGAPAIDPETGNVHFLTSAGVFGCYTPDGKLVWEQSLMETLGRLTFTNGRTGGPVIDNDLVIVRSITSNWGGEGPASDRFYAFDKKSGKLIWSSTPGAQPKDPSFARPWFGWRSGKRVMYSGSGDGSLVCLNVRTGEPIWRYPVSAGGMNSSVVVYKNLVIGIHNDENLDSSDIGRMVAVDVNADGVKPTDNVGGPILARSAEKWRNPLGTVSSSPVLVGNRIYQVVHTGHLCAVDADTGEVVWKQKLAPDQLHASPTYADGKLYVPMQNGLFYILKPGATDAQELCKVQLAGRCLGAPVVWQGRIYVTTTERIYCFGKKAGGPAPPPIMAEPRPKAGPAVALQIIPAEVLLKPGQKAAFTVRGIDANGFPTGTYPAATASWAKYIPPTARVRAEMNGEFNAAGELVAGASGPPSAGAFQATIDGLKGTIRGRVMPDMPLHEDFESFNIAENHLTEPNTRFAYPPLPWIGARFKFEVRELPDGNKVLAKTLDNIFFQRATVFLGRAESKNYTMEADVMADGNRRNMSTVGLINQHYMVLLLGNDQKLEVNSNHERIKVTVPFTWSPKTWYRLKTRVDVAPDGSGTVRAKAWKKADAEPSGWTLEVPHRVAHTYGAPGLFGFAPQSQFRVYIDNVSVTPNN